MESFWRIATLKHWCGPKQMGGANVGRPRCKAGAEIATRDNTRRKNKCTLEMRPSCYYTYYTYYAYYYYYYYY